MRVLLISANTEMINMPVLPLGLGCIARATQEAESRAPVRLYRQSGGQGKSLIRLH